MAEAEYNYYEALKQGLEEAAAYKNGDHTHCRVAVREPLISKHRAAKVTRTGQKDSLSRRRA